MNKAGLFWMQPRQAFVAWKVWCSTLKRVVWYFEEGGVLLGRGGVLLGRERCVSLKRVVCFFEEWFVTLKRVV